MHMEMVLVLLLSLVICQFIILLWKNYHLRSYQVNWSGGEFVVFFSYEIVLHNDCHVGHSIWFIDQILLFSFYYHLDLFHNYYNVCHTKSNTTTYSTKYTKVQSKINEKESWSLHFRLVYKWFLLVYKVSYGMAIGGYFIIMMTFLGLNNLFLILPQVMNEVFSRFIWMKIATSRLLWILEF